MAFPDRPSSRLPLPVPLLRPSTAVPSRVNCTDNTSKPTGTDQKCDGTDVYPPQVVGHGCPVLFEFAGVPLSIEKDSGHFWGAEAAARGLGPERCPEPAGNVQVDQLPDLPHTHHILWLQVSVDDALSRATSKHFTMLAVSRSLTPRDR